MSVFRLNVSGEKEQQPMVDTTNLLNMHNNHLHVGSREKSWMMEENEARLHLNRYLLLTKTCHRGERVSLRKG